MCHLKHSGCCTSVPLPLLYGEVLTAFGLDQGSVNGCMLLSCVVGCVGHVMSCDISTYKGYAEANGGSDN